MRILTYFSSDLHLGHDAAIVHNSRPFKNVDDMDRTIIRRWNAKVKDSDIAFLIGDICFHRPVVGIPLLRQMKGRKILIQGNHDKYSHAQYLSAGFSVVQEATIDLVGKRFRLSHYPYPPTEAERAVMEAHDLRYMDRRPTKSEEDFLLCGHVHKSWKTNGTMINVGVDQWNFHPVSQGDIESLIHSIRKTAV